MMTPLRTSRNEEKGPYHKITFEYSAQYLHTTVSTPLGNGPGVEQ